MLEKQPGERIVAALVKKHGLEDEDIKLISCHNAKGNPQRILKVGVKQRLYIRLKLPYFNGNTLLYSFWTFKAPSIMFPLSWYSPASAKRAFLNGSFSGTIITCCFAQ